MRTNDRSRGVVDALASGVTFGLAAPLAKRLGADVAPLPLASLLYLGAGLGLVLAGSWRRDADETPVRRGDASTVLAMIAFGGLLGPLLMLFGFRHVSGVVGALLLNLEAPFTMALAVVAFGEHLAGRALLGALLVLAGATITSTTPGAVAGDVVGVLAVAGACLAWAIDNNLAARLALRDPVAVARWKTLGAGTCGAVLSAALGFGRPGTVTTLAALAVGFVGYGVSIVLAVRAMRVLGAARQAAFFAIAPFVGAVAAVPILGESLDGRDVGVALLMAVGIRLLWSEEHAHVHTHEPLAHDHLHVHDEHHRHAHAGDATEPHAHPHVHEPLTHAHAHTSDAHHRHRH